MIGTVENNTMWVLFKYFLLSFPIPEIFLFFNLFLGIPPDPSIFPYFKEI